MTSNNQTAGADMTAIQPQSAEATSPDKKPRRKKGATKPVAVTRSAKRLQRARKANKRASSKAAAEKETPRQSTNGPRPRSTASPDSKKSTVLGMIARPAGATLGELMEATGWQAHSVRGFISTASKRGLASIESTKREDGMRVYSSK